MKLRTALLATTVAATPLLALPGTASAQGYSPNRVSGVYIAAGAGFNWLNSNDISSTGQLATALSQAGKSTNGTIDYNLGWAGVVSLGYGFGNGVRVELEGNYRENEVDTISGFGGTTGASGKSRTYGVMANAFYDFDLGQSGNLGGVSIVPYVGIGAGYAWREFDNVRANVLGGTVNTDGTDGRFAYQAIAGVAVPLTQWAPGLAFTAEYRFFGTLEHDFDTSSGGGTFAVSRGSSSSQNYNNSIMFGLRYAFNAAPPPPPPVVAPAAAPAPARTYLVFFDWNRADLTDRARQIIDEAAQNAQRATGVTRIEVSGHADRSGTPQYNQRLSERRAQVVAAELERRGIPRSAMVIQGFGESRPLVPTADGVREPQNRRVEIVLR